MAKKSDQEKIIAAAENQPTPDGLHTIPTDDPDWNIDNFERASSEIWRPEEGEYVMGLYDGTVLLDKSLTEYDEDVHVHFIIEKDSGNKISFVGGKMCDKFIEESPIDKGVKVFIRYMGQGATRKGNKVNNYDIRYKL